MKRLPILLVPWLTIALILPLIPAFSASKNIDIIVTHDMGGTPGFITTATFQETTGANQAANWPLIRGQSFRTGDVPVGSHVEIRVASGSTCSGQLLDYQWDQISTRTENGQDGSWRHAVYTVRLPAVLASRKVTIAFCRARGSYSPTASGLSLSNLCSAHPLSMAMNNVANQDGSRRGSGTMTFNLCDYISTTGRESPIETANGPIRHSWIIRGEPTYATSGNKDPQIYVRLYVDAMSDPSGPARIDRIRYVFNPVNGWMTVAAGTDGYATSTSCNGSACPAGFTNDPQAVYYTPIVKDGSATVKDYDAIFSETVGDPTTPTSTVSRAATTSPGVGSNNLMIANPGTVPGIWWGTLVTNTSNLGSIPANCYITDPYKQTSFYTISCATAAGKRGNGVQAGDNLQFDTYFAQINQPGTPAPNDYKDAYFSATKSAGNHLYYTGEAFKYTTTGTAPAGMTNGAIYFANTSLWSDKAVAGNRFQLARSPDGANIVVPTTLGSGNQKLTYLVSHRKFTSWYTSDIEGQSMWSGSPSVDPFEYTLDQGSSGNERNYWETTGTVPPIKLSDCASWTSRFLFPQFEYSYSTNQYYPNNVTLALGGSAGGEHSYIGIVAEWTARWWCDQDINHVRPTRIFALDGESFPGTNILNEETGLMPTLNNGPPVGSGGGGGTPYAGLGSLFPGAGQPIWETPGLSVDILDPLRNSPAGGSSANVWARGPWPSSIYPDHQSAYNIINYQLFGDAHTLDAMQMQSNRMRSIQIPNLYGPHAESGGGMNGGFTFPAASGTPPAGKTFYGQIYHGSGFSQGPRAGAWVARNLAFAAAMGADNNPLRKYFFDMVVENANWWAAMQQHKDCSSISPYVYQPGIWSHSGEAAINATFNTQFMNTYNILSQYFMNTMLHAPDTADRFNGAFATSMRATAGTSGWPTSTPAIYSGSFFYWLWDTQNKNPYGKCVGPYVGTESDFGYSEQNELIDMSSGKIAVFQTRYPDPTITFTSGDKVKNWDILQATAKQGSEDGSTGDSISNPTLGAPSEMPLSTWMCIVNIDNTNHIFQVAAPAPDCGHPGSAVTSFTGTFQSEYCSAPGTYTSAMPSGFNASQTWNCQYVLAFRTQNPTYPANRTYVYWAGSGYAALAISGVSNAKSSYNLSRAAAEIIDLSSTEAAFDWDPDIVVP